MSKTFTLELKIVLTDEQQQKLIEAARRVYVASPPSVQYEGEDSRELGPEEFIDGPQSALMYVIDENPLLDELGIQTDEISYTDLKDEDADDDPVADEFEDDSATATEEDLDAWAGGLYLCRWPNGDFSVVQAESKRDALVQLDELAGALAQWVVPLETFMADFRLDDEGRIEFKTFGEGTREFVRSHCYPELEEVLAGGSITSEPGEYSPKEKEIIKKAVERERTRLWDNQSEGPEAETEMGKRLQASMGTTGPVADHYVKLAAKRILESDTSEDGKPN